MTKNIRHSRASGNPFVQGVIKHYDWGRQGKNAFIPKLLGIVPEPGKPYAELWYGTKLPFLLKVLDVSKPLSVQCHPDARHAREGFKREERARIPPKGKERVYKDPHPKPEMVIALSDFFALCGFKNFPGISFIDLFGQIMAMDQKYINLILSGLIQKISDRNKIKPYSKKDTEYWLLKAHKEFDLKKDFDRGLFSYCFCNLVHLKPDEALYLSPGEIHSYQKGTALEISRNSDNTLRGGLTSKKIAIYEFLDSVNFQRGIPRKIHPNKDMTYRGKNFGFSVKMTKIHKNGKTFEVLIKSNSFKQIKINMP